MPNIARSNIDVWPHGVARPRHFQMTKVSLVARTNAWFRHMQCERRSVYQHCPVQFLSGRDSQLMIADDVKLPDSDAARCILSHPAWCEISLNKMSASTFRPLRKPELLARPQTLKVTRAAVSAPETAELGQP